MIYTFITIYVSKKFWCHWPEDGKITAPKYVGPMLKIVHINYSTVYLLVLHELLAEYIRELESVKDIWA